MKYLNLAMIFLLLSLFSCTENNTANTQPSITDTISIESKTSNENSDKEEIQKLIRDVLLWSETKNVIDLLPTSVKSTDSIYDGFDKKQLKANLEILKSTNLFSTEFIDNYNRIILTLDKKVRNNEFDKWLIGDLPPFNFLSPWCDCQDVPYDNPNAFGLVDVVIINLNKENGELFWKWGKLGPEISKDWKDFKYKFAVKKEAGKWKISYLQGFDFNNITEPNL